MKKPLLVSFQYLPLPKYKVRGNCVLQTCGAHCVPEQCVTTVRCILAAHIVCQNSAPEKKFAYEKRICSKLAVAMCRKLAESLLKVCGIYVPETVLARNVRRRYAAHSCRALFWHTCALQFCSEQLSRTILAHNVAVHCAVLPPPHPRFITPTSTFFFSSLPPGGVWEKMSGW